MGRKISVFLKNVRVTLGVIVGLILDLLFVNRAFSFALRRYIRSFEPVRYDGERTVPEYDEELGHFAIRAGNGVRIMMLTDLHIGGGFWSHKRDKKTIFELISMLQKEKPDLVILCGDNAFAVPGPYFHGGGTIDNDMAARVVIELFEHEQVYFTTVFGNHDTEAFGTANRIRLGKTYQSSSLKYSICRSEFSDPEAERPSVTNQILVVKNTDGSLCRLILLMDTNDYADSRISTSLKSMYDTIHDRQTEWAKEEILALSRKAGLPDWKALGTLCFFHIPPGEYEAAFRELSANGFADTESTEYISGVWDEKVSPQIGGRIWYGGCCLPDTAPEDADRFFETMGPDGIGALDACFCGHDHVNTAVVRYKGVVLGYGLSMDNTAYRGIRYSGRQRGCTIFTIQDGGEWSYRQKNVYVDCGVPDDRFCPVRLDTYLYPNWDPPAGWDVRRKGRIRRPVRRLRRRRPGKKI